MDINFEYYKIFYYVAKYRNITKAAAALGRNQPNITRIMKLLEAQLNCKLFVREARGVSLTEEGEKLYSHVEIAYKYLLNAEEELRCHETEETGTVEIGATETALHIFLLDAMKTFKEKYPKIRIKIHNHTTPELVKLLVSGILDFALITTPFESRKSFQRQELFVFQEILAGGIQYSHLCNKKIELGSLETYPWIGLGRGTATYELYKRFFLEHKVDIELAMEVATSDLMIPLIQNNLGIGFVPQPVAVPLLDNKQLVQLELENQTPMRSIEAVYDKERGKSRAADNFYKYLISWMAEGKRGL